MGFKVSQAAFLVCLLSVSVVQAQRGWGVTYTATQICALKGSTVDIRCTYTYPSAVNENVTVVERAVWFTERQRNEPLDLQTAAQFAGRVQYRSGKKDCTLRITDLRESDSAQYTFSFTTNQPGGRFTGSPGVTLSVTALQVLVNRPSPVFYPNWAELKCLTTCGLPGRHSYVWYQNEWTIHKEEASIEQYFGRADRISCAVKGYEKLPSPSVCVRDATCNRVTYTDRSICALNGSSVDISCTYGHQDRVVSKFWFSPSSQPVDLKDNVKYAGRVQVFDTQTGRSTLRIVGLRESDSAQYHFKFRTHSFEWKSRLPATTLTVTALQVQVTRATVRQSYTEAELRCVSSCSPAGRLSYVWFKNGHKNMAQQTSTYTDHFYPGDIISCAFTGHEDHRSPAVYPSELPSVSVSPSGEIVEGSSVTLTCRTDANPAAKNTLHKENQVLPLGPGGVYHITSISSEDRGMYCCKSEDQHAVSLFIDVQYAPKLPSVSASPSAEVVEGSSVTLTCSSDANPEANYTWYKEDEESPKASEQNFTITDFRPEHSGGYSCEVQNSIGRHNGTLQLTAVAGSWRLPVALSATAVFLTLMLLSLLLWIRRERSSKQQPAPEERPDDRVQMDEIQYAAIQYTTTPADSVYSNADSGRPRRYEEDSVVYSTTRVSSARGSRRQAAVDDPCTLYSSVNKKR